MKSKVSLKFVLQASVDEQLTRVGSSWQWWLNDTAIPAEGPGIRFETTSRLVINNVERGQHEGEYSCRLITRLESLSSLTVPVHVFAQSEVVIQPNRLELLAGQVARLSCLAQVDNRLQGMAVITWHRSGHDAELVTSEKGRLEADLVISSVQPTDSGTYTCRVRTPRDESISQADLVVRQATRPQAAGGRIQRFASQALDLPCTAIMDPDLAASAALLWFKDSSPLVLQNSYGVTTAPTAGQLENNLRLTAAQREDEGDYVCRIQTSLETVEVKYRLDIYAAPKEFISSASESSGTVRAVAGRPGVELDCTAEIDPRLVGQASLSWTRDNSSSLGQGRQSMLSESGTVLLRILLTD